MGRGNDRKLLSWPPTQKLQTRPPDTPTTHSTSTHTCYSQGQTHHPFGSQITPLSAPKRSGTPEHTPHPSHTLAQDPPSGARGAASVARRAGPWPQGAHRGSLLRIPKKHLPHQGSTESTGLCPASPGPGSTSISTLSPQTPMARQCLAAVTIIHP